MKLLAKIKRKLKINYKGHVNIWVRKSIVKFGKQRTILIEVVAPDLHFFIFKKRHYLNETISDPIKLINQFEKSQEIKELVNKDQFLYFNGEKIEIKELL